MPQGLSRLGKGLCRAPVFFLLEHNSILLLQGCHLILPPALNVRRLWNGSQTTWSLFGRGAAAEHKKRWRVRVSWI